MRLWLIILHREQNGDRIRTATLKQQAGREMVIGAAASSFTR